MDALLRSTESLGREIAGEIKVDGSAEEMTKWSDGFTDKAMQIAGKVVIKSGQLIGGKQKFTELCKMVASIVASVAKRMKTL